MDKTSRTLSSPHGTRPTRPIERPRMRWEDNVRQISKICGLETARRRQRKCETNLWRSQWSLHKQYIRFPTVWGYTRIWLRLATAASTAGILRVYVHFCAAESFWLFVYVIGCPLYMSKLTQFLEIFHFKYIYSNNSSFLWILIIKHIYLSSLTNGSPMVLNAALNIQRLSNKKIVKGQWNSVSTANR